MCKDDIRNYSTQVWRGSQGLARNVYYKGFNIEYKQHTRENMARLLRGGKRAIIVVQRGLHLLDVGLLEHGRVGDHPDDIQLGQVSHFLPPWSGFSKLNLHPR